MPSLPGSPCDVFFGDTERPLPNWREALPLDGDDEEDEPSEEEIRAVVRMLGFDPRLPDDDAEDEAPE